MCGCVCWLHKNCAGFSCVCDFLGFGCGENLEEHLRCNYVVSIEFFPILWEVLIGKQYQGKGQSNIHANPLCWLNL